MNKQIIENTKIIFVIVMIFTLGFIVGQTVDQHILPLTKMALYEKLSSELRNDYPVTKQELAQGRHIAAVYAFGTYWDVLEWYYVIKWGHTD